MEQVGFEPTTFRRITGLQPAKRPIAQLLHYLVDADRVERSQTYLCAGRLQLLELANAQHVRFLVDPLRVELSFSEETQGYSLLQSPMLLEIHFVTLYELQIYVYYGG